MCNCYYPVGFVLLKFTFTMSNQLKLVYTYICCVIYMYMLCYIYVNWCIHIYVVLSVVCVCAYKIQCKIGGFKIIELRYTKANF